MSPHQRMSTPSGSGPNPQDKIRAGGSARVGDGGQVPSSAVAALQARHPHQSGDAAPSAEGTPTFQHGVDAWGAVGAA